MFKIPAYSFLDCNDTISGPGGSFALKGGNAPEGITIIADNDMTETVTGADGHIMHSLMEQGHTVTVTVNLLKTSPVNSQLMQLLDSQRQSASTWGANTISLTDKHLNDDYTVAEAAFIRVADNTWGAAAGTTTWTLRGRMTSSTMGVGLAVEA